MVYGTLRITPSRKKSGWYGPGRGILSTQNIACDFLSCRKCIDIKTVLVQFTSD